MPAGALNLKIYLVIGSERTHMKKAVTILDNTHEFNDAESALVALIPMPPGWRLRVLTTDYAVYLSPDDKPGFCSAIVCRRIAEEIPWDTLQN